MRQGVVLILAILAVGCAAAPAKRSASRAVPRSQPSPVYADASAGALAFDPPIASFAPPLDLERDGRQPEAFVSYDELTATFFDISTCDRQTTDRTDRYVREATFHRVGISYR